MSPVTVHPLKDISDLIEAHDLFDRIWKPAAGSEVLPVEMMRALAHTGNYLAGAYVEGRLVGASVGFLAEPGDLCLHSHVTGVEQPGLGIGRILKEHQREWALEHGITRVTWTYDPLVARNAHFNLNKLGARAVEYLPAFYGRMSDGINAGDSSDRVLVEWRLTSPSATEPLPADAAPLLISRDGHPEILDTDAATVLLAIPPDIEELRRTDPALAASWRAALRETLGPLLSSGGRVLAFEAGSGGYVVRRQFRG